VTALAESQGRESFTLERVDASALRLVGTLNLSHATELWGQMNAEVSSLTTGAAIGIDMADVSGIDGGALALLIQLRADLRSRGVTCEFVHAPRRIGDLVHLYGGDVDPEPRLVPPREGVLDQVGRATLAFALETKLVLAFLGTSVLAALGLLREPRTANWRAVVQIADRAGADAVPIVLLINFLVGFVMAFQGAVQLKQFGANIFVADLVGLSVTRELGPLMTAIIVCGRSGAAFAAELGTMKVSEEIDALRTLGFGPVRYLVLPRVLALILVMPILILFADLVGILGGLFVGLMSLDLTVTGYLIETRKALGVWDVGSGLVKGLVFGAAIAVISCQQGFATTGGAEGVGRRTTSSVVAILFTLILIDAAFTIVFHGLHL
jgi:phospholipid/cholesterol/gamma-HCH transport system permease protein